METTVRTTERMNQLLNEVYTRNEISLCMTVDTVEAAIIPIISLIYLLHISNNFYEISFSYILDISNRYLRDISKIYHGYI